MKFIKKFKKSPIENSEKKQSKKSKTKQTPNNEHPSAKKKKKPFKKKPSNRFKPESSFSNFKKSPKTSESHKQTIKKLSSRKNVDTSSFQKLGLSPGILKSLSELGYEKPTPIQHASIEALCNKSDLLGCAQTGTGKTAAFALPLLERFKNSPASKKDRKIKALILTPTRELALQVSESFTDYGRHLPVRTGVVFGGVNIEHQKRSLRSGIEILVATPGRLLDLYQQKALDLSHCEALVLDEADRMLDMGFLPDVKRIIKLLPERRQNILFSATMPHDIERLAQKILKEPVKVEVAPVSSAAESVSQTVYRVNRKNKRLLLLHVLSAPETSKVLIFARTKAIANRLTKHLLENGISSAAIHGNKSQAARQRALEMFKDSSIRTLVASDLAARGIDIDDITHVINYDLPNTAETYVHRIGRTGRANAKGEAISFCDTEERPYLREIEAVIKKKIEEIKDHPYPFEEGCDIIEPRGRHGGRKTRDSRSPKALQIKQFIHNVVAT